MHDRLLERSINNKDYVMVTFARSASFANGLMDLFSLTTEEANLQSIISLTGLAKID
jgi:hypothetical protein